MSSSQFIDSSSSNNLINSFDQCHWLAFPLSPNCEADVPGSIFLVVVLPPSIAMLARFFLVRRENLFWKHQARRRRQHQIISFGFISCSFLESVDYSPVSIQEHYLATNSMRTWSHKRARSNRVPQRLQTRCSLHQRLPQSLPPLQH